MNIHLINIGIVRTISRYLVLFILLLGIGSCSVNKSIGDGQFIVAKNNIHIAGKQKISKLELEPYIIQPPTPKALAFFYTNLWVYKTFSEKKNNAFNRWIVRVFGDEPVIWDPQATIKSEKDIQAYLNNVGYFDARVYSSIFQSDAKVKIDYKIDPGQPYIISANDWEIEDSNLSVEEIAKNTLIKAGQIFNTYQLDEERTRISDFLRSQGYYDFNPEYVKYLVDSTNNNHTIHITTHIDQQWIEGDSIGSDLKRYHMGKVFIYPDYEYSQKKNTPFDTLVINLGDLKKARAKGEYHFLYKDKLKIKPTVVAQSIFIEPDEYFNSRDVKETYHKLNQLPIYKYTNISFQERQDSLGATLDTYVKLNRSRLQFYSLETDGTNSSGDLGIRLGLNYGNKNVFRGGELLNLRAYTAVENRKYTGYENTTKFLFFNTLEFGLSASLYSPTFVVPLRQSRFPKYFTPHTFIRFAYNYQLRPSYERHISSFQFGYEWKQRKTIFHRLVPLDLSVTKIFPSENFQAALDTIQNPRYKDQYKDHFIASIKYNFTYNTQSETKYGSFTYLNARIESAGNVTYGLHELFHSPKTAGYYQVFGIPFAQFLRMELDYRHYIALTNKQGIIYRINTGLGLPYGNSLAMPFEKGFYGGGANGMRAWAYRDLGPGVFTNDYGPEYDKMGDVKLEGNLEFRFPFYSYLKGAAFVDVGNVWLLHESETFPGGHFAWDTFYKQFAVDGGIGFRLDLDFFIIRVDGAVKIQDPSKEDKFVLPKSHIKDIFWSFGIGYPF